MTEQPTRRLVFDTELMRPACVLIQAGLGGDSFAVSSHFRAETWLVSPTENMQVWRLTDPQLQKLADLVNKHYAAGTLGELAKSFRAAHGVSHV